MDENVAHSEHQIDLYWRMYSEQQVWRRHHESLRANVTNIVLTASAGVSAVILYDRSLDFYDVPLSLLVIVIGYIGFQLCDRHYERAHRHSAIGRAIIDHMFFGAPKYSLGHKIKTARENHANRVRCWARTGYFGLRKGLTEPAWELWLRIHIVIAVVGAVLVVLSILGGVFPGQICAHVPNDKTTGDCA